MTPPAIQAPLSLRLGTGAVVVLILLPLIAVAVFGLRALVQTDTLSALAESVLAGYITNTLLLSGIAGFVALGLGLPGAWFVTAYRFSGSRVLRWSLVLPMAMPAYVLAYAYTDALDPSGWLYQDIAQALLAIGISLPRIDIRSLWGAGLLLGVALSPYVALLAKNAFEERQGAAFDAARALGLKPTEIFFRLALPMARPAWIAGLALVVMECFADYGTVAFFSVPTLSTGLFKAWFSYGDRNAAALIALLMMITIAILLWFEYRARGRAQWASGRVGTKAQPMTAKGGAGFAMMAFCALPGLLGFVFPLLLLLHTALTAQTSPRWSMLAAQVGNTIFLGLVAVAVIIPVAWLGAYALRASGSWLARAVRVAAAGYAMPGLVIAVGLLAWSGLFTELADRWLDWRVSLVTSGVLVIAAYLTRFFAVGLGPVESAMGRVTRNLEWSASSLGLSRWQIFSRVHLPLMRGATGVAALIIFVDVVKELPATLVLRPFNLETLAVSAHHLASDELLSEAAWPAIMIGLVGLLPLLVQAAAPERRGVSRP
jgi:iron(III) transport system permease protein